MTDHSIPPLRDLPPGRLDARQQHLLTEIAGESAPRHVLPSFAFPRLRLVFSIPRVSSEPAGRGGTNFFDRGTLPLLITLLFGITSTARLAVALVRQCIVCMHHAARTNLGSIGMSEFGTEQDNLGGIVDPDQ